MVHLRLLAQNSTSGRKQWATLEHAEEQSLSSHFAGHTMDLMVALSSLCSLFSVPINCFISHRLIYPPIPPSSRIHNPMWQVQTAVSTASRTSLVIPFALN